jgi:hypothetical protein
VPGAEKGSHDGRKSVGETRAEDDDHVHDVVHERGCAKVGGAVVSHHHGVGETEDYNPELTYHYGQPDRKQRLVVLHVFSVCKIHSIQ